VAGPEPSPPVLSRLAPPIEGLLAVGRARLVRQSQYARALARGGAPAAALGDWVARAADCIAALARPQAVRIALSPATPGAAALAGDIPAGDGLGACLVTLGYGQDQAFARLERDYALHHVQTDLAREVLFALARAADRDERVRTGAARLRRVPVTMHAPCGGRRPWDPARVQALLAAFGGANPGVRLTDAGFFDPLHSLLGLSLPRRG
jgi:hypothetical protein